MTGDGMSRTIGKEPLHQWSCMYHQSGGSSTQVSRIHFSFSYPVPPYMYLRMIVRKEIVFTPRARTLMDMRKRFELRDLVARHTWYISSSRPQARNNIPVAHSPDWDQKVMLHSAKRKPSGNALKRLIKKGHGKKALSTKSALKAKDSSVPEGATFHYYTKSKAKVTDQMGNQLRMGDSTIIDTLDIHMYAFLPETLLPGIPVALNLSGTNKYLACRTPPSLTLEALENVPDNVNDDTGKRIIFWQKTERNLSSFESVLHPGYLLCTRMGDTAVSLELRNDKDLQRLFTYFLVSRLEKNPSSSANHLITTSATKGSTNRFIAYARLVQLVE